MRWSEVSAVGSTPGPRLSASSTVSVRSKNSPGTKSGRCGLCRPAAEERRRRRRRRRRPRQAGRGRQAKVVQWHQQHQKPRGRGRPGRVVVTDEGSAAAAAVVARTCPVPPRRAAASCRRRWLPSPAPSFPATTSARRSLSSRTPSPGLGEGCDGVDGAVRLACPAHRAAWGLPRRRRPRNSCRRSSS